MDAPHATASPAHARRVPLARRTLAHEWRRYLAAVLALGLSGAMTLVQVGLLFGLLESYTAVLDRARADLWVTSSRAVALDLSQPMPESVQSLLLVSPAVAHLEPIDIFSGEWRGADGRRTPIALTGYDVSPGARAMPAAFGPALRRALEEPGGVVVDRADADKLGATLGSHGEIGGRRVRVVGYVEGFRAAFGANVYASLETLRLVRGAAQRDEYPHFAITLAPGVDPDAVAARLEAADWADRFVVWRPAVLAERTRDYWLTDSGTGAVLGTAAAIAALIGLGITSQTLRAAVLGQLREFAALRALGASAGSLRLVVLRQSAWLGAAGVLFALLATATVAALCHWTRTPISFPPGPTLAVVAVVLATALASGTTALGALYRTQPADLLR